MSITATSAGDNARLHFQRLVLEAHLENVAYRLVPLDHPEGAPEQEVYDPLPRYVAVAADFPDDSLDFVVIDGPVPHPLHSPVPGQAETWGIASGG